MKLRLAVSGFTLVEILAAVVILALALTTLIGLQTNYANAFINEENRLRAALYAQYIMTFIEIEPSPPSSGSENGTLTSRLRELGFFATEEGRELEDELDSWNFSQTVTDVEIPPSEAALLRVDLTVSWGESSNEQFLLVYFAKNPPAAPGSPGALGQ